MLNVACPGCGERGKIPGEPGGRADQMQEMRPGVPCGRPFGESRPPPSAQRSRPAARTAAPVHQGIAVEGLDAEAWSLAPESSTQIPAFAPTEHPAEPPAASPSRSSVHHDGPFKEYKLLTSRDKSFEGRFDIARLEVVLNQLARQGWTAKSICLPHLKNFQGAMQEEVVVLLER